MLLLPTGEAALEQAITTNLAEDLTLLFTREVLSQNSKLNLKNSLGPGKGMQCEPPRELSAKAPQSHSWSVELLILMGLGNHLHCDGEHTRVGCERHAGCEHHLLTVTVKGTVIRAPSCWQGKGNVYLFMGFPAYEREIMVDLFLF